MFTPKRVGGQFAQPSAGYGGATSSCPAGCSAPRPNNGLTWIINDGVVFPQNTGFWQTPASMGSTAQQWMDYASNTWTRYTTNPVAPNTGYAGVTKTGTFATLCNFGCNIKTPVAQITSISFWMFASVATTITVTIGGGAGSLTQTLSVNGTWQKYVFPIAGNAAITNGLINQIFVQSGNTGGTFYIDQFAFLFANLADPCYPSAVGPLGYNQVVPTLGNGQTPPPGAATATASAAATSTSSTFAASTSMVSTTAAVSSTSAAAAAQVTTSVAATVRSQHSCSTHPNELSDLCRGDDGCHQRFGFYGCGMQQKA